MSITGNYDARAENVVKQVHRQDGSAALHFPDGSSKAIVLRDPEVILSEDWAPYLQLSGESVIPATADELALVDPRQGVALEVLAGYVYEDQTADIHRLAYGHLRARRATLTSGTMALTAASAEQLAQDTKWLPATITKTFTGVLEALKYLAAYAHGVLDVPFTSTIGNEYRADLVSGIVLEQGAEVWPVMSAIALSAGLRVWADENGDWNLAPKNTIAGVTAGYLKQGPATTVKEVEDALTRDNWYNAVALTYTWKNSSGVEQRIVGTYAPAPAGGLQTGAGCRTYTDDRPGPISQYQANENARLTAANLSTRGASYVVESVAMYWLRPGMTVQIQLANGTEARHIARRIVFHVAAGTMTVTTREPSNLGA